MAIIIVERIEGGLDIIIKDKRKHPIAHIIIDHISNTVIFIFILLLLRMYIKNYCEHKNINP